MPAKVQTAPLPGEMAWVPPAVEGDLQWPERTIYGGDAKWSSHKGAHKPCDLCVEVIHSKKGGPHPAPATMRRKGPNGDSYACNRHGTAWKQKDEEIKRKLATMRETADLHRRANAIPTQRRGR